MDFIFAIIIGIVFGILTGIIPGIHINLVATTLLSLSAYILEITTISNIIIFIITMGTIHSFIDFIPSILFGVPDSDTALSVLPAHKLVLDSRGYEAIFLSSLGSFFGMIFSFALLPIFILYLEQTYAFIKPFIPFILTLTIIILILMERSKEKKLWALSIIIFSGALGSLLLNSIHINDPLLILFTGLFGIASIYISLETNAKLPEQTFQRKTKIDFTTIKATLVAGVSSTICSVSPGLGSAQAGTLAAVFFKKLSAEIFIVVLSSINTINFILSFITFYAIQRARNGSVFVISQLTDEITLEEIFLYLKIIIGICVVGFFLTLKIGKFAIKIVNKLDFRKVNIGIGVFLIVLILILTGPLGVIATLASTVLGILCVRINVRRVHLMGCLLVPVIFNLL